MSEVEFGAWIWDLESQKQITELARVEENSEAELKGLLVEYGDVRSRRGCHQKGASTIVLR